jgi:hypothetical protein
MSVEVGDDEVVQIDICMTRLSGGGAVVVCDGRIGGWSASSKGRTISYSGNSGGRHDG